MRISAKLIAHTRGAYGQIWTFQLCYPRFIHSQLMTHRVWARNARSSRAVPTYRLVEEAMQHPVVPLSFGQNCKGMSAKGPIPDQEMALNEWMQARDNAVIAAKAMTHLEVHKQIANRILEPFLWMHSVVTMTDRSVVPCGRDYVFLDPFNHFCDLRISEHAQPEIKELAMAMVREYNRSEAVETDFHLPYIVSDELGEPNARLMRASSMRCARVSYKPPDSADIDMDRDVFRCNELIEDGHHSPLEHPARSAFGAYGPFIGWNSFRAQLRGEA